MTELKPILLENWEISELKRLLHAGGKIELTQAAGASPVMDADLQALIKTYRKFHEINDKSALFSSLRQDLAGRAQEGRKYMYIANKGSCKRCQADHGKIFDRFENVSKHPNCKCFLKPLPLEISLSQAASLSEKAGAALRGIAETAVHANTGVLQGLTLGFADEIGAIPKALGYAIGAAATGRENPLDAAKRGYLKSRDEHRQDLKEAWEKSPGAVFAGEVAGSIISPLKVGKAASVYAPLAKKASREIARATATGAVFGFGSAEGDGQDHAAGAVIGALFARTGQKLGNKGWGRGAPSVTRSVFQVTGVTGADKFFNEVWGKIRKEVREKREEEEKRKKAAK